MSDNHGLTVEQLAQLLLMTSRNVRSFQSRGLLEPPRMVRGRAYYTGHHVAQLLLIRRLQARGFSLESIGQMLADPQTFAALVCGDDEGLGGAVGSRHVPIDGSIGVLRGIDPTLPEQLLDLGILRRDPDGTWSALPEVAALGAELRRSGVEVSTIVDCHVLGARAAVRTAELLGPALEKARGDGSARDLSPLATQLFTLGFEAVLTERLSRRPAEPDPDAAPV